MSGHRPDQTQRDRGEDDQGLRVGTEGNRHQRVHHQERQEERAAQIGIGLLLLPPLAPDRVLEQAFLGREAFKDPVLEAPVDLLTGRQDRIHVRGHRHRAAPVHPLDGGRGPCEAGRRHLPERNLAAGCAHQIALHIGR